MGRLNLIKNEKTDITKEELISRLPEKKGTITDEIVAMVNQANSDPAFSPGEFIRTMVDYKDIMLNNRGNMEDYINAIKFCAYLESEDNATEAYRKARANDEFVSSKVGCDTESAEYRALTHVASRYRQSKLVRAILSQTDMPLYLVFQKSRYQAVQVLHDEMLNAPYSKDRISAAEKLLTHVKAPENVQIELGIGMDSESKSIQQSLNDQLMVVAARQKQLLEQGVSIADVQKLGVRSEIVEDAEIVDG